MNQIFPLQDNARLHSGPRTGAGTATIGWTFLPHPPYSPEFAPSDSHPFGLLKDALRGRRFADGDELKHSAREELRQFSKVLRDRHTASHAKVEKVR